MRSKEKNSSSELGIHFGHYIAGVQYSIILRYHDIKTTIVLKLGFALDLWSRGLSVMLKKKPGITLIEKLRLILLMEADSNASYKEIFGNCMLNVVISYGFTPEEIYSEKGKTVNDCHLAKVIIYVIVQQERISSALSSIVAAN